MKCPLCKTQNMTSVDLASGLPGSCCDDCHGVWVPRDHYENWRISPRAEPVAATMPAEVVASNKAKICPQCTRLMLPYRVGHGLAFAIDACSSCGGIWLDRNEWDALRAKELHDDLHEIISAQWQAAVRRAEVEEGIEKTYRRLLGPAYEKAHEFRTWLVTQPERQLILTYLSEVKAEKS